MDCESKVYALVLGTLVSSLREALPMRQAELADQAGISASMVSRIERGRSQANAYDLRSLVPPLQLDQTEFLHLVELAWSRTEKAARQTIERPGKAPWWRKVMDHVGEAGVTALVRFAVASVIADHRGSKTRAPRRIRKTKVQDAG